MTQTQTRHIDDTSVAILCELQRPAGTNIDLTGATVTFRMVDATGTPKVADTAASIVDAPNGLVAYTFNAADVDTADTFYAYFIVTRGGKDETFPSIKQELVITIEDDV